MPIAVLALLLGIAAGCRSMMPVAAIAIAASRGMLALTGTPFEFLEHGWWWAALGGAFAIGELIGDKLPVAPSRKALVPLAGRLGSGAVCGAILGATHGAVVIGALAGVAGAVIGTFGGYEVRRRLAAAFRRDLPAALIEDGAIIAISVAAVCLAAR